MKTHQCAHFDERSALRKFGGLFVLHAHQSGALTTPQVVHGADRNRVARGGLADGTPVSGSEYQGGHEDWHHRDHGENQQGLFHLRTFAVTKAAQQCGALRVFCQLRQTLREPEFV